MTEPAIEVTDVVKTFGSVKALDGVTFEVAPGEVLGLLGPNGAGKTTIINVLSTLMGVDSGSARVLGHDVATNADAVRRAIATTGQFAAIDDVLTGRENLVFFGRLRGLTRSEAGSRAGELLERFSLTDAADKAAGSYSGGMRRRLDLAASLVVPTPVLFLDEPTTGLDPRSRNELWGVVKDLRAEGRTIVLTTQYLEEADQLAERIIVIDAGRVVAEGTPDQLKARVGGQAMSIRPADLAHLARTAEVLRSWGDVTTDDAEGVVTLADIEPSQVSAVLAALDADGVILDDMSLRRPTLDEVFLYLTGGGAAPEEATA
ncbi:MAG: ATP-binding cassette domain-containing protein [Actinomycetota bacterium]